MRIHRIMTKSIAGVAAMLALAGCTGTQDPSQAGFLDGVANLAGGTYDRRVAERQAAAASAEWQADQLALRAAELETERQRLAAEQARLDARVRQINAEVGVQSTRLATLRNQYQADTAELARLEAQLSDLQRQLASSAVNPTDQTAVEIDRLEREIASLTRVIDNLIATTAVAE